MLDQGNVQGVRRDRGGHVREYGQVTMDQYRVKILIYLVAVLHAEGQLCHSQFRRVRTILYQYQHDRFEHVEESRQHHKG